VFELIDGSFGEGGGQILRNSIAISALTGKPIKIENIRVKRENPGLRPQHLLAVKAIAELCDAQLEGAYIGSRELKFIPSRIKGGNFYFDVGTAGSISLVLQAVLPVLAFADSDSKITIKGGTAVPKAPTIEYLSQVLFKYLNKMGLKVNLEIQRHGFYPRGGGLVNVFVERTDELSPLILEKFGALEHLSIYSYSEGLPCHVVDREVSSSLSLLSRKSINEDLISIEKRCNEPRSNNIGNFFIITAKGSNASVIGYDKVGMKGLPAEKVAEEPTRELLENIFTTNAAVDMHAGDQLLIWMSLAKGESSIFTHKYTMHAYTTLYLLKKLLAIEFEVIGEIDKPARIKIKGIEVK